MTDEISLDDLPPEYEFLITFVRGFNDPKLRTGVTIGLLMGEIHNALSQSQGEPFDIGTLTVVMPFVDLLAMAHQRTYGVEVDPDTPHYTRVSFHPSHPSTTPNKEAP